MVLNKEDSELLETIIDYRMTNNPRGSIFQLIVRPDCNQNCEYCYLKQHGLESYPLETRVNSKTTIRNIKLITEYLIKKNYFVQEFNLFAGDMFYDDLFFEFIDYLYIYYEAMLKTQPNKFELDLRVPAIVIPCNFSFCKDPEKIKKVQAINDKFNSIGVTFFMSYSSDGIYSTDVREKYNVPQELFDTIMELCSKNNWGVHPMVGYENIDNAIKNYEWWKAMYKKYPCQYGAVRPSYLEVRNEGWDENSTKKYLEFIDYMIQDIYENEYHSNLEEFIDHYLFPLEYDEKNQKYKLKTGNNDIIRLFFRNPSEAAIGCGLGSFDLNVNVAQLNFVPCHRLAYPVWSGGHFTLNEEKTKITGIQADDNVNGYLNLTNYDSENKPGCVTCEYQTICMKGCAGSQYESMSDPYYPIPNVCEFLKSKYEFLIKKYYNMGVFDFVFEKRIYHPQIQDIYRVLMKLGYKEYSKYDINK